MKSDQLTVRPELKNLTTTFVQCLEAKNKIDILRASAKIDLPMAMRDGTNIRTLKIFHANEPDVFEALVYQVLDFGRSLQMLPDNEAQQLVLMDAAIDLIDNKDNACFTFEEIIYCIRRGSAGGYGKTYGKINREVINTWLDQLYVERMTLIENEHISHKDIDEGLRSTPLLGDSFQDLVNSEVKIRLKNINQSRSNSRDFWKSYEQNILNNEPPPDTDESP